MTEPVDDLAAYKRLLAISRELEDAALCCVSVAAITALGTIGIHARMLASGLYRAQLRENEKPSDPPEDFDITRLSQRIEAAKARASERK